VPGQLAGLSGCPFTGEASLSSPLSASQLGELNPCRAFSHSCHPSSRSPPQPDDLSSLESYLNRSMLLLLLAIFCSKRCRQSSLSFQPLSHSPIRISSFPLRPFYWPGSPLKVRARVHPRVLARRGIHGNYRDEDRIDLFDVAFDVCRDSTECFYLIIKSQTLYISRCLINSDDRVTLNQTIIVRDFIDR